MNFERLDTAEQYTEFGWFVRFPGEFETKEAVNVPQLQPGTIHKEFVGDRLLGLSGDTILGIRRTGERSFHVLYSFKVIAPEDLAVTALVGVVLVLLAFILSKV